MTGAPGRRPDPSVSSLRGCCGIVVYETADVGPTPCWIIRADDTGRREVIAAYGHAWETLGALNSAGILEVWEHGPPGTPDAWTGETCADCHETPVFPAGPARCPDCDAGAVGRARALAHAGTAPDPF